MTLPRQPLDALPLFRLSQLWAVAGGLVLRLCEGRFGITRREWRLIATLASRGALGSSELATLTQLDRARTSKAVGSLVEKKLVLRSVHAADRRQVRIELTDAGLALYDALFPLVTQINAELMAALDSQAVAQLDLTLALLQERAMQMQQSAILPKADRGRGRSQRATP